MGKAARIKYLKPELTKSLIKLMKNYKKTQSHPLRLKPLNVEQQAPSRHRYSIWRNLQSIMQLKV